MNPEPFPEGPNLPSVQICPVCKYEMDCATGLEGEGDQPGEGDLSLCLKCGELMVFDHQTNLRQATINDMLQLDARAKLLLEKGQRLIRSQRFLDKAGPL